MTARPRICWILDDTDRSGESSRLHALLGEPALAERFERHVISLAPPGAMALELQSAGAALHAATEVERGSGMLDTGVTVMRVMTLLKGLRPDVVHACGSAAAFVGTAAARLAAVPAVVVSPHSEERRGEFERMALTWALRGADQVLADTEAHAASLAARHGIVRSKLRVVSPLATAHRCAHQQELPALAGARKLVSLVRFHANENLLWIVECVAILRRFHPGICWTVFGTGVAGAALLRAAGARGLDSALKLPGETDDPLGVLLAADIFVQPRRTVFPPQALLEAMHAGRAVVSVDAPGARAVMTDGREGLLVHAEPASLVADAVDRLLMSAPLREDCARHAQERMRALPTAAERAREFAELYGALAGRALSFAV